MRVDNWDCDQDCDQDSWSASSCWVLGGVELEGLAMASSLSSPLPVPSLGEELLRLGPAKKHRGPA